MTRTHVVRQDLELGRWAHAARLPDQRLRPLLDRGYVGFEQESTSFERWLEPPQPALTLMFSLDEPLRIAGAELPHSWIAGLSLGYDVVDVGRRQTLIDLKLTPLGAHALLGLPLRELADAVVPAADVLGSAGEQLSERLREAPTWDARFDLLDQFLLRRAAVGTQPRAVVRAAWTRLRETAGRVSVTTLAAESGISRRHLTATFHEHVGLPPKAVARLLRFAHVRRRIEGDPASWADIAWECGYFDQSHLNRDFRQLAGTTPGDFVARRLPGGGGVIGDGVPFVQDRSPRRT